MNEKIIVQADPELQDIIPGFLENKRKDVGSIQAALGQGDYETIRILGHSMKGAGGGYGFDAITEIGASIEQSAKNKNSGDIAKWVDELSSYLERVEVVYE